MPRNRNRCLVILAALLGTAAVLAQEPPPTPLITKTTGELIAVLKSDASREEKAEACRELAVVGDTRAVPELVGLLSDEKLNHMALYALETMPGASVDKALRRDLTRLEGRRLICVIGSLGARRDYKAMRPLLRLLRSSDAGVEQAAARALGQLGNFSAATAMLELLPGAAPANRASLGEGCLRCAERLATTGKPGRP